MHDLPAERRHGALVTDAIRKEAARLNALERLDMLDAPMDEGFERVIRLIREVYDVEIGIVSLIDAHRQWYQACVGFSHFELPRKDTFCRIVVDQEMALVVENAATDPRFAEHPAVSGPAHVRFYVGMPLKTREGHTVGTVCVIDREPRSFSDRDLRILEEIAGAVMDRMELLQFAATDGLTGVMTRRAFRNDAESRIAAARRNGENLSVIAFDIDHFKTINDTKGHAAGDDVLKAVSAACRRVVGPDAMIGRLGGEEFAIVLAGVDEFAAGDIAEELRTAVEAEAILTAVPVGDAVTRVTASFGFVSLSGQGEDIDTLLAQADAAMYRAKHEGRNRCIAWNDIKPPRPSSRRRRVVKAGTILIDGDGSAMACTIRTLGDDGAGLAVSDSAMVPDRFRLFIDGEGRELSCRVTTRDLRRLDVSFELPH